MNPGAEERASRRILVDMVHPAHVHFFRHPIAEWQRRGHLVTVTATSAKPVIIELLDNFRLPHLVVDGPRLPDRLRLARMLGRSLRLWKICRQFRPDVVTAIGGIWAAQAGFLARTPVVLWDDTEHHLNGHRAAWPFATAVYSPDCYTLPPAKKQVFYAGCHELSYLHPGRFSPDPQVVARVGIDPKERYCIVRFVSWTAEHDIGQHGIDTRREIEFVRALAKHARPYITSEKRLPRDLEPYRLSIPVHEIHHVMAFAQLVVGEGATMISEAALLGVPAVYVSTLTAGTLQAFERAHLVKQTASTDEALRMCVEWLADHNSVTRCRRAKEQFLRNKIDVAGFVANTVQDFLSAGSRSHKLVQSCARGHHDHH